MAQIRYGDSYLFLNGEKIGHLDKTADSFSVETRPEFELDNREINISAKIEMTDEQREFFGKAQKEIIKYRDAQIRAINDWVEDCLRTRVAPPIKGEITKGKVRWRGLALCYGPEQNFIGILQHKRTLYCVDGNTYENYNGKKEHTD